MLGLWMLAALVLIVFAFVGRETWVLIHSGKCPHCRAGIDKRASVCAHCGHTVA